MQKSYLGKVKMIYIDPPYNTGNDFVYRDDFAMKADEYDLEAGNMDELGNRFRKTPILMHVFIPIGVLWFMNDYW